MQGRGLTPSHFRNLSALAASEGGRPVRHPAGDSTLTPLPCGGFKVTYDPSVASGTATFRMLTPGFVLGLIDLTPRREIRHDLSDLADPRATMIFISLSSAAPTPWEDRALPADAAPQTVAAVLPNLRDQRPRHRVGARVRAVTLATLSDQQLGEFEPCLGLVDQFGERTDADAGVVRIAPTDKAVISAARQMFSNPFSGAVLDAYLRAKTVEILCLMRNGLDQRPTTAPGGESVAVEAACAAIDAMLAEPLDVEAVAEAAHVSVRSLVRRFKAETGMTLGEYQRKQRLALAARLLLTTEQSITTIAGDVGFSETASFSRAFMQHFSLSPSEFRRLSHA